MFHRLTDVTEKLRNFTAVSLYATFHFPAAAIIESLVLPGFPDDHWDRDEQTNRRISERVGILSTM